MAYRPIATLNIRVNQYQSLSNFSAFMVASMTGNLNFPAPSPALATIVAQQALVVAAIATWGPIGNRGSHADLLDLRNQSLILRNLLLQEMSYVQATAYASGGNDYVLIAALISTSGYAVKNAPTPQGLLAPPQNLHQVFKPSINIYTPALAWKKPIGLTSPNNVHIYQILRGATNIPTAATMIGTSTRCSYTDMTAASGTQYYYFIRAVNTNGAGAYSADCFVATPV